MSIFLLPKGLYGEISMCYNYRVWGTKNRDTKIKLVDYIILSYLMCYNF